MKNLTTTTPPETFIGFYGNNWARGLLSEHADLFVQAGGVIRTSPSARTSRAVLPDGSTAPVVCSEIIRIDTEDGPQSGRCGLLAERDGCCDSHADMIAFWRTQSDMEVAQWERDAL